MQFLRRKNSKFFNTKGLIGEIFYFCTYNN